MIVGVPNESAAEALARVHVASWRAAYGRGLLPATYLARLSASELARTWRQRLSSAAGCSSVRVAMLDDELVGFVTFGPCHERAHADFAGEIRMLYVHPQATQRGAGRQLMQTACAALERQGWRWLVLWVVAGNAPARRFYETLGLVADGGQRIERFDGVAVEILRLAKPLRPVLRLDELLAKR